MAEEFTGTVESGVDTGAYDLAFRYKLRPRLQIEQFATVKPTNQSHRGATVQFTIGDDLAIDTTPLNEYVDVESDELTDTPIVVSMTEYGRAATTTAKLRGTSFLEFDPTVNNRLAYNAAATVNRLARNALGLTTNDGGVTPGSTITSADLRAIRAQLVTDNVEPWDDGFYVALVHPRVAVDLKGESDPAGWRTPQEYAGSAANGIMRGELGVYEGFRFIEDNTLADTAGVYDNFFLGQEGLAKAFSDAPGFGPSPVVRAGPVTDKLNRFRTVGWYWLGGYKLFREEAVVKYSVASGLDAGS